MAIRILKIYKGKKSKYLVWSTVVDAPIWHAFKTRREVRAFLTSYWGRLPSDFKKYLDRADRTGCSSKKHKFEDVIAFNQAGKNLGQASLKEIIKIWW